MSDRFLRISQIASQLGWSSDTVLRLVRKKTIPGGVLMYAYDGRKGEKWLVERAAYEAWLASRVTAGNQPKLRGSPKTHTG